jgi:hypothetical protein
MGPALQQAGWQHPETLTWVGDQGQFFSEGRQKILKGLKQAVGS